MFAGAGVGDGVNALFEEKVDLSGGSGGGGEEGEGGVERGAAGLMVGLGGDGAAGGGQRLLGGGAVSGQPVAELVEDELGHGAGGVAVPHGKLLGIQLVKAALQLRHQLLLDLGGIALGTVDLQIQVGDGGTQSLGDLLGQLLDGAGTVATVDLAGADQARGAALGDLAVHGPTAPAAHQPGEDVGIPGLRLHRRVLATDLLHPFPQLPVDDRRVLAWVGVIVLVSRAGVQKLTLLDDLDRLAAVPVNHADVVVIGYHGLDGGGSP